MRPLYKVLSAGLLASLALGCGPKPSEIRRDLVRKRSAREWRCDKEAIRVRHLGGMVYEAEGCGERATYACEQMLDTVGPYVVAGDWRCVLESRDGYPRATDRQPPPPAPRPAAQPRGEAMPGWSGGEATPKPSPAPASAPETPTETPSDPAGEP